MINIALRNTIDFPTMYTQAPTEINLLVMSKEASVESASLPIIVAPYKQAGSCGPQHLACFIILSLVFLHIFENPASAEGIAKTVDESTGSAGILE